MGDFTLDTSVLSGAQFSTGAHDLSGDFRDIQFHFFQSVANQDMEVHYLELHVDVIGVSME
jgi:hypothetical protein